MPRTPDAPEVDGWFVTFANRRDKPPTRAMLSCILILDTARLEGWPVA